MRNPLVGVPRAVVAAVAAGVLAVTGIGVAVATRSDRPSKTAAESSQDPAGDDLNSSGSGSSGTGSVGPSDSAQPGGAAGSAAADGSAYGSASSGAASASPTAAASPSTSASPSAQPAGTVSTAPAPAAATGPEIRPEFFGLHVHSPATHRPTVAFGSVRLWDSGVTWKQLQPSRNKWNFATLDAQVAQANAGGKDIIMVLGVTPQWAAARPAENANYGAGAASEPKDLADWTTYVRTLAERYRGKITKWELWNEPNAVLFWSGGAAGMVPLAKAAYGVLKAADPGNVVLSPGVIVRTENSPLWLDQYLAAGGGKYADVIAAHFYVKTRQRPEYLRPSIERIQSIMAARGVADKPLWNTESSLGEAKQNDVYKEPLASAYLARALVLLAGHRVQRSYWYAWDDHGYTGLYLTTPNGATTQAGHTFGLLSTWLVGAKADTCLRLDSGKSEGAFVCSFSRGDERFQIAWHPGAKVPYDVPAGFRTERHLSGTSAALTGATVSLTPVPVLITTAAS